LVALAGFAVFVRDLMGIAISVVLFLLKPTIIAMRFQQ
jgi:hypothetical protein